ncbi:tetraacyldisaccharide 4'-kinase [Methylorubrum populi BJ001]|jgi:tetraacyldisaccharide 4'-kinase|uniref:Tetraacyldisaccharide 4'-kinase n=1 Tax=Methylorubrum populi (strain ATCC BAA-705 / NCIMB 13946 / BJ001) TaxID=441620 RepID=LPXK_METPB|nr:tetraacyldisaccharide 4'-kinase [Methylorubrum populi]B1ZHI5.1 RecName: Full=Tetraacyldisaccharide 4'-kinase; AltName: Full=Lipid A 4'-kinase [Methylorubrum populi BJ001]ACB81303.1 tetraacyldisaccharide 4'-kinase [Methylorubrum populi BJ001]OAH38066.1 tetraacyldisaccharide 4'-kinase [Methylorubrum populi]PZP66948.1 MAG: tetraacyldisaccharide 4'-kinase [Methylorubrum populi]
MRPPGFWSRPPTHPLARILAPVGRIYGGLTADRMDRPGAAPPCPVLCVGNFTLGGAGKTPTALALAGLLRDLGRTPAFLSRGYGGRLSGPVIVDPARHRAEEVGDEPLLLARAATAVVARDRPAGARLCAGSGADVIVMDDGLQNPSLSKSLSLAVIDGGAVIGNGLPFPAGPLRAPLLRQWRHVAGLVLIGEGMAGSGVAAEAEAQGLPVHRARLVPEGGADWAGRRVVAFAGIGRPQKFFETLRALGAEIVAERAFPDHHPYRPRDWAALTALAAREGGDLVTTAKDAVRLPPEARGAVAVLTVALAFDDEAGLRRQLAAALPRA